MTAATNRTALVEQLRDRARFVRTETVRLSRIAGAGHYASSFSAAELLAALYYAELRVRPTEPDWPDRDRFVLSKGHAAIGLYPVLADLGYFDPSDLDDYTRLGSRFGDHPGHAQDRRRRLQLRLTRVTGSRSRVGIALAGRVRGSDHRTWCMLGDGELAEGQIWEAAMAAGHYQLGNLVAIVDRNQMCIDGFTDDVMAVEPLDARFADFGWHAQRIDGHDLDAILNTFSDLPRAETGPAAGDHRRHDQGPRGRAHGAVARLARRQPRRRRLRRRDGRARSRPRTGGRRDE